MIWATFKAQRWDLAVGATLTILLLGWLTHGMEVHLFIISGAIPASLLIMIAATAIALTPLYATLPELDATLPRERGGRLMRLTFGAVLAFLACLPAVSVATLNTDGSPWPRLVVLVALGVLAVVCIGDHAWMVVIGLGMLALVIDGSNPTRPVAQMLQHTGLLPPLVLLGLAMVTYVRWGPRAVQ